VLRSQKHKGKGNGGQVKYLPLDAVYGPNGLAAGSALGDAEGCAGNGEGEVKKQKAKMENRSEPDVARFSCWCPKAMAQIGHFPETLADRCIIITMQRKTPAEKCERLRNFKDEEAAELRRQCAEFVEQHREEIANAEPAIPEGLNDRAGDIWEPLFVLADLAGGDWPEKARQAALALSGSEQTSNLTSSLLLDCLCLFAELKTERMFTRDLVQRLNWLPSRPWRDLTKGKPIDEYWLSAQLRPFGIKPRTMRVAEQVAKGYMQEDFLEPARRYVAKSDWEAYKESFLAPDPPPEAEPPNEPPLDPGL
jgi:hypothetical protein